ERTLAVDAGEAMSTEGQGDLAAMMNFMFKNVPDDPLARKFAEDLPLLFAQLWRHGESLLQIVGGPTGQRIGNDFPGNFKPGDQFGRAERMLFRIVLRVPVSNGGQIEAPLTHPDLKPPDAVGNNMLRNHAD